MRTLLLLAFLAFGMSANAQDLVLARTGTTIEMNDDTTGIIFTNQGVGFSSPYAAIAIGRFEGKRFLIFETTGEGEQKGIRMAEDGSKLIIKADAVIIFRKTFASHAQADSELLTGEEYYLAGDRGVYRKP